MCTRDGHRLPSHDSVIGECGDRDPGRPPRGTRLPRLARRRTLLGAAQEVFVAQGYHAAAMDEIAERAGVSKPVLYQHFPGKLELYLALLDEHAEALVKIVREALESTTDNKLRVQASMQAFYDFVVSDGEAYRLVFESDLRNVAPVRARVDRANQQCAEMIAQVIAEDTNAPAEEAHLLGMGLVGMAEVSARFWLSQHRTIPKDTAEKIIARLAWRGISGFPAHRPALTRRPPATHGRDGGLPPTKRRRPGRPPNDGGPGEIRGVFGRAFTLGSIEWRRIG